MKFKQWLNEKAISLDDLWSHVAGPNAGKFEIPDTNPDEEEVDAPELETDYIDDAKRMSRMKKSSKDYSGQERALLGATQTRGLPKAVELQIQKFYAGRVPQYQETSRRMQMYSEVEPSEYYDFVLNYVKKSHLDDFSKAAGENLGWENEHIAKAMGDQGVQDELTAIQNQRDAQLQGLPDSEDDDSNWSPQQADVHLDALAKSGEVVNRALSDIGKNKPQAVTNSIEELYRNLPAIVDKGINLRLDEYDFERAFARFFEMLNAMRTPKEEMPGAVSAMMGGLTPYADETVTNPNTGEKTRRWDFVHRRINAYTAPVSGEDINRAIQNTPASPFELKFYTFKMPYAEKVCSMACFLYPEMRGLGEKELHDKFTTAESNGDESMLEGMATRFFRIVKTKRMDRFGGIAKREADEERKNREYLQRSADSLARFNASKEEPAAEETAAVLTKLPVSDRNKMVSVMMQNKIIPGNELFKYIDGISNGNDSLLGEARIFRPKGELPKDLPPRPGSADDFAINPETGELARTKLGNPIHVNRDSVARKALDDLKSQDKPVASQAIGVGGSFPGTVGPEQFVEILDAFLGHRTFEEGAVSLSSKTADFMTNRAARGRGRLSANAGRLATWYADFVDMLQETPDEDKAAFFSSCAKGGFPIDENMLFDWNAPESERVALGRAYLLFNWAMRSGQPASAISINDLFVADTKGLAQHLFKSRVLYSPNEGNPIVWGGDKRGDYFGTRDEALAQLQTPVPESFERRYNSSFAKIYSEIVGN